MLHLGQADGPSAKARRYLHPWALLGRSTHARRQADKAIKDRNVDYFCVGPVYATSTKPDYEPVGLDLVRYAARKAPVAAISSKPWFAIGGISMDNIDDVIAAGARRVCVVRAITQAADPQAAADRLSSRLRAAWKSDPAMERYAFQALSCTWETRRQLELAPYCRFGQRRQAGAALVGDLGIVQRLQRSLVVVIDHRLHRVPGARLGDHLLQLTDPRLVKAGIAEPLQQQLLTRVAGVGVRVGDQHRALALTEIISGGLAGDLRVAEDPEQVVAELEGPAERRAVRAEREVQLVVATAQRGADLARPLHGVARRLVLHHPAGVVQGELDGGRSEPIAGARCRSG